MYKIHTNHEISKNYQLPNIWYPIDRLSYPHGQNFNRPHNNVILNIWISMSSLDTQEVYSIRKSKWTGFQSTTEHLGLGWAQTC